MERADLTWIFNLQRHTSPGHKRDEQAGRTGTNRTGSRKLLFEALRTG
jgi:hypothetical protein